LMNWAAIPGRRESGEPGIDNHRGSGAVTDLTNDQLMKAILRALKANSKRFADAAKRKKARSKRPAKAQTVSRARQLKASGSRSK
jgi:polysaccharide deacetylase 2 family uncharacterized protein YibQ